MEHIVKTVGCMVASVDWRKAPEHPYPAARYDCYRGLKWTVDHAAELGVDADRIAVGGASSGGGLAAGLVLLARDRGGPDIAFQLLIYPMIDDRNVTPSSHAITYERVWTRESNLIGWRSHLAALSGTAMVPPYAAASRATNLADLPPTFIAVGDLDLFLDESLEYAQRLAQALVRTEFHVYPGAFHGFDLLAPDAEVSKRFARDRDEALQRALQRRLVHR